MSPGKGEAHEDGERTAMREALQGCAEGERGTTKKRQRGQEGGRITKEEERERIGSNQNAKVVEGFNGF